MLKEKPATTAASAAVLLLGAACYLLWCARSFISAPAFEFPAGLPRDAENEILRWQRSNKYFQPQPFTWSRYLEALGHPATRTDKPVSVMEMVPRAILVMHSSRPGVVVFSQGRSGGPWDTRISMRAPRIQRAQSPQPGENP